MKLHEFLIISSIARVPSVVSSTVGGSFVSSGQYWGAVLIFVITGAVSLVGLMLYNKASRKIQEERTKK